MLYGRQKNLFDPKSEIPFKLSRSRLENFTKCPRCFYLDRRLGIGQPSSPPFSLNNAVDELLKKEFDILRENGEAHALCTEYGIDAVPFKHEKMDEWRDSLRRGIQYLHEPTNLLICGGVDDVWVKPNGELIIVDYKATAKNGEIEWDDSAQHHKQYKRQMEIYQWLFRKNGFQVDDIGYFVYVNGQTERDGFHGKLEFTAKLLPHTGDDSWVEPTIIAAHQCLMSDTLPESNQECEFCQYRSATRNIETITVTTAYQHPKITAEAQIWQAVLKELGKTISKAHFQTWFEHTKLISLKDSKATINAQNVFIKSWIDSHYKDSILDHIRKHSPAITDIEIVTDEVPNYDEAVSVNIGGSASQ